MASARTRWVRSAMSEAPGTLEDHIEQNIDNIVALQRRDLEKAGRLQRVIETISGWMSRPGYLILLVSLIFVWLIANIGVASIGYAPWDRAPFAVLDSMMTLVALVTGTVVLVAQQRQGRLEQQHSQLALQIGLLTEQKTTKLILLLEELRRDMPMVKDRHDAQAAALQESANAEELLATLSKKAADATQAEEV